MHDGVRRQWLEQEARAAAALDHPNICPVFDVGEQDGRVWIAMQYVEGETLAQRLRRGPLELSTALDVAIGIAGALHAAHARGIVHRDIKPENVMIAATGQVKVLDFGLATVAAEHGVEISQSAQTGIHSRRGGTLPYMSPEQLRGDSLDSGTDVFSFGAVLFELLTGRRAFVDDTDLDVAAAVLSSTPPDITALDPVMPQILNQVTRKCLEKDSQCRYRDAQDLVIDLASVKQSLRIDTRPSGSQSQHERPWWKRTGYAVVGLLFVSTLVAGVVLIVTTRVDQQTGFAKYTQLTDFTDAVSAPSLSADGRMVAFIRSDKAFLASGQIYLKLLPNGKVRQLTNTPQPKLAPAFSPDGSYVTYTEVATNRRDWDTWSVPVTGGPPTRLLPGGSGLTWLGTGQVMYSEFKPPGPHMGIVTSTLARTERREVYFPAHERGMAHYSYASPDRRWVLTVEMDARGLFGQCRLVPFSGGVGRDVGPRGTCMSTGWSPDGRWMYFTVVTDAHSHVWRQSFPDGPPQQVTFGPTEEEGLAVAPDGQSLITSIGQRHSAIWLHTTDGERAITTEGFAFAPRMSPDGRRLFYLLRQSLASPVTELYSVDLVSGGVERHLPEIAIAEKHYDISRDGQEAVYVAKGADERPAIWIARLDRRTPPRLVVRDASMVSFGAHDDLLFVSLGEKTSQFVHTDLNGNRRTRVSDFGPILNRSTVSPDGSWVILYASKYAADGGRVNGPATFAVPVRGGAPRKLCTAVCEVRWSGDGTRLFVNIPDQRTLVIPISPEQLLPDVPACGLDIPLARLTIANLQVLDQVEVVPVREPSSYVYVKTETRRNLYRIPLQ
jgi:Tol biopolymer transport system component